ncbi:MAG: phosphoribosylformylglycinamidine synthase subunit PurQ [Candidatus Aenigmatarchaeota archaeon]
MEKEMARELYMPTSLVVTGDGVNCEKGTANALRLAGFKTKTITIYELEDRDDDINNYDLAALVGGFSGGDDLGAGTVQATKFMKFRDSLYRFVEDKNKLMIGICNGAQTMMKLGLFSEDYKTRDTTLTYNDRGSFYCGWIKVKVNKDSPSVFTKGVDRMDLIVRHGEGRFDVLDNSVLERIKSNNLDVMHYIDDKGDVAVPGSAYNPNGSMDGIAGVCDRSGRIFALMPHPETSWSVLNHPQYTRMREAMKRSYMVFEDYDGDGLAVFRNAGKYLSKIRQG